MLRSPFSTFEQDPFFNFDKSFASGFDDMAMRFSDRLSLEDRPHRSRRSGSEMALARQESNGNARVLQRRSEMDDMLAPFSSGFSMFGGMSQMMENMHRNMEEMMQRASQDPNAYVYQSSNFYSYDACPDANGQGREPRIYQAHHSVQRAGDIKEEHKGVRDSRTGDERMHVGRYIRDRGEVQERRRNMRTGDVDQNRELVGLETDEDAARFEENWREKTRRFVGHGEANSRGGLAAVGGTDRHPHHHDSKRDHRDDVHRSPKALEYKESKGRSRK